MNRFILSEMSQPDASFDPSLHHERATSLLQEMTLEEKLAQLCSIWINESTTGVAPMQEEMTAAEQEFAEAAVDGLGQFTRIFGSRPVDPVERLSWLRDQQRWLQDHTRLGIPAIVHEECLTGVLAWKATAFPTPLAWGATFNPNLVEKMGSAIGNTMQALGIHQGLAPVLDVIRDARWGRVEECISEDPYVVGTIGTAYVLGLQGSGIVATLKHLVGHSASRAGRNLAPTSVGERELGDVLLIPFEMAILDGGARSVMHSYGETDGVPVAADTSLLTTLLRDTWGFSGTVVADYFGIAFLESLHRVAESLGDAAAQALAAGIDVELPRGDAYRTPLATKVRSGEVPESLVDRAVLRVLTQKSELGLLDRDYEVAVPNQLDLDPPEHRAISRQLAEESVILLSNVGVLPAPRPDRVAVIGPNADRTEALLGCYSFANHVLSHYPGTEPGIQIPTVLDALRHEWPGAELTHANGCAVNDEDHSQIAEAVTAARNSDLAVVVVGDQAGMFGRGTVGEGCDRDSLELPGLQRHLVEAVLATGTPVVLVLVTGRPYAIDWALRRCQSVLQAFFGGEAGAAAIAGVLSGRINPSGHLPVSLPRSAGSQPYSYLHSFLGGPTQVSSLDTSPVLPFGHGLSYTSFIHRSLHLATKPANDQATPSNEVLTSAIFDIEVTVTNSGSRSGADVVQLYAQDLVGSVTRPVAQLLGYQRVHLEPGRSATVRFSVPATRLAFTDRNKVRIVEPGRVDLWVGPTCLDRETQTSIELTGPNHVVRPSDERLVKTRVSRI